MTEWQPITWILFHVTSLNYDEKYREHYITFYKSLKTIIPCRMCRNHYINNINKPGMTIEENVNAEKIFNWTIDLHNTVNKANYKKQWTYEQAKNHYVKIFFNNNLLKIFTYSYLRANFKKNPQKTGELINMIKTLPYLYPYEEKRNKLIDFREKFDLNRETIKNWLYAFMLIIGS